MNKCLKNKTFRILFVGFLLILIQFLFSGYAVICVLYIKGKYDPWLIALFRVLTACPVNFLIAYIFEGKFSLWYNDLKCQMFLIIFGFTHVALNALVYIQIIIFVNGSYASILTQLIPIFSSALSIILSVESKPTLKNKGSIIRVVGIIAGVGFAISVSSVELYYKLSQKLEISNWIKGIFRAIMEAIYYVVQMKLFYKSENNLLKKKPWTIICLSTFYGSIIYILIFSSYACGKNFEFVYDKNIILPSLYSGIINISVGYGLLNLCVKYSSAIISSCMFSMNIATTLVFLRIFANEQLLTSQYILSVPLILSGFLVIFSPFFNPKEKVKPNIDININNTITDNNNTDIKMET